MPPDTEIVYNICGVSDFFTGNKHYDAFLHKINQLPSWSKFSIVVGTHNPKDINQHGASMWAVAR